MRWEVAFWVRSVAQLRSLGAMIWNDLKYVALRLTLVKMLKIPQKCWKFPTKWVLRVVDFMLFLSIPSQQASSLSTLKTASQHASITVVLVQLLAPGTRSTSHLLMLARPIAWLIWLWREKVLVVLIVCEKCGTLCFLLMGILPQEKHKKKWKIASKHWSWQLTK